MLATEPLHGPDQIGRGCREHGLPVTVLGLGSNFLVLDSGVRGMTVRLSAGVFAGIAKSTFGRVVGRG